MAELTSQWAGKNRPVSGIRWSTRDHRPITSRPVRSVSPSSRSPNCGEASRRSMTRSANTVGASTSTTARWVIAHDNTPRVRRPAARCQRTRMVPKAVQVSLKNAVRAGRQRPRVAGLIPGRHKRRKTQTSRVVQLGRQSQFVLMGKLRLRAARDPAVFEYFERRPLCQPPLPGTMLQLRLLLQLVDVPTHTLEISHLAADLVRQPSQLKSDPLDAVLRYDDASRETSGLTAGSRDLPDCDHESQKEQKAGDGAKRDLAWHVEPLRQPCALLDPLKSRGKPTGLSS